MSESRHRFEMMIAVSGAHVERSAHVLVGVGCDDRLQPRAHTVAPTWSGFTNRCLRRPSERLTLRSADPTL